MMQETGPSAVVGWMAARNERLQLRLQLQSVLSLSAEDRARVQPAADAKHLPVSTSVRSWIRERLDYRKGPPEPGFTRSGTPPEH